MWDPPGPGHEPVSPALAGGFPTTAPPGKSEAEVLLHTTPPPVFNPGFGGTTAGLSNFSVQNIYPGSLLKLMQIPGP